MFNIGDKVVYPSQGVGEIKAVQERSFKGENVKYYEIEFFHNSLKTMIPIIRVEQVNIRLISDEELIDESLKNFKKIGKLDKLSKATNPKERMAINAERVKEGTLEAHISIVYSMSKTIKDKNRTLNLEENMILTKTKTYLIEEISQSKGLSIEESKVLLTESIQMAL